MTAQHVRGTVTWGFAARLVRQKLGGRDERPLDDPVHPRRTRRTPSALRRHKGKIGRSLRPKVRRSDQRSVNEPHALLARGCVALDTRFGRRESRLPKAREGPKLASRVGIVTALAVIVACAPAVGTSQTSKAEAPVSTPIVRAPDTTTRAHLTAPPTSAPTVAAPVATVTPTPPIAAMPVPTVAPAAVRTAAQTPAPTAALPPPPASLFVTITHSGWGRISAATLAGASCSVRVRFPSGSISTAQGVQGTLIAGSAGSVSWSYSTRANTLKGTGTNTVTCTHLGQSVSASAGFTVQ